MNKILYHVINYRVVKQTLPLVVVLRKRRFSFLHLLLVNRAISVTTSKSECAEMSTGSGDGSYRVNITNGLLLYYHQYSFYSQKV